MKDRHFHINHRLPYGHRVHLFAFSNHLAEAGIPFVIGIACGCLALLLLRHRKLRWTWALCGAPLAYLIWQIDWQLGLTIASAITMAAGSGAWWYVEETGRGGDEAREAHQSLGPWHVLRAHLARRHTDLRRLRAVKTKAHGRRSVENRLALGINRRGEVREVAFGGLRGVHALVLGATGSGKTVTQAAIAQAYVLAGLSVIVLDPKGDAFLRGVLQGAASHAGVTFREWSPSGRTVYNPFGRGNPTEIADKALAGHRWSEPHYELATQRLLGQVLTTMQAAGI